MKFTIDAASLVDKQTCKRKFILNNDWRLARWRPKLLFDVLLRRAILQLTQGKDVSEVASNSVAIFHERASSPGLDIVGRNPYQVAKGWTSLLQSVLHGLAKTSLPVLHDVEPQPLSLDIDWRFLSWADDSGTLHRWVTVESWDDETLSRELHSWRTFGDLVMSGCPMVLHAIVLGRQREGRFYSPWTRAYAHPWVNVKYKWIKPEDTTWKSVQLVDQKRLEVTEWVDEAWSQRALQPLLQDQSVELPAESVIRDTKYQLNREAEEMRRLMDSNYLAEPMSRGACDLYIPCAFQNICHSAEPVDIGQLGLYVPRKASYSVSTEVSAPCL